MSAVLATASPRRIKATHRRRRKIAAGHFVQRYYDPQVGRFLSVDPMAVDTKTAANFCRYCYANNNPFKFIDPDGRAGEFNPDFYSGAAMGFVDSIVENATAACGEPITIFGGGSNEVEAGGYKFGHALSLASQVLAPGSLAKVERPVALSPAQSSNLARFDKKLPTGNTGTTVTRNAAGVKFSAEVPGKVPGSRATYQKTVDASGKTVAYSKTTYDPNGKIVHIKDKMK